MELFIPEGVRVHVTIGDSPPLALPHDPGPVPSSPARVGGRIVKGIAAVTVLVVAFEAGQWLPHRVDAASPALAAPTVTMAPSSAERYQPPDIPPAFRAQLARPSRVTPPPGHGAPAGSVAPLPPATAAPAPAPSSNPFGLQG